MRRSILLAGLLAAAGDVGANDWPMFGGRPERTMAAAEKNLPTSWSVEPRRNVRWMADLGTQTYSSPVVAGGRIFIGTNNGKPRDPAVGDDRGILMCFSAQDGAFLWQAVHDKLYPDDSEGAEAEDHRHVGICSTPAVAGNRVYYVSNRAELVCLDVEGFRDGQNDGPYREEQRTGAQDADIVWILDMRRELGITPHQASASSPLVVDGLVFVLTGQGRDYRTQKVRNPAAPSFVAVDAATGKVVWKDSSPGDRIVAGQWGSPAYGVVDGRPQVAFPGGDGWVYAFEPRTGELLWKFDALAGEAREPDGRPKSGNYLTATPVFAGHRVIVALGQDTEASGPPGCLRAVDARSRGDVTASAELWRIGGEDFGRTIAKAAVHEGLVYAVELDGYLNCVDLETGRRLWREDLLATVWGAPLVADGKVYVRTGDGETVVFAAGREKKVLAKVPPADLKFANGAVVAAHGVLYMASDSRLYAVASDK